MYVLGSATNVSAPLRLQNTCDDDGWISLGKAYGVSPQAIIQMQPALAGKTITKKLVQSFVKSLPGWSPVNGLYPFDSKDNPGTVDANGRPEGYAHFTAQTQLMLPDMPRLDGKTPLGPNLPPGTKVIITKKSSSVSPWLIAGGLGLLFVGLNELDKRKKRRQGSRALALTA